MKKYLWLSGWACGLGAGLAIGHPHAWPYSAALIAIGLLYAFLAAALRPSGVNET